MEIQRSAANPPTENETNQETRIDAFTERGDDEAFDPARRPKLLKLVVVVFVKWNFFFFFF